MSSPNSGVCSVIPSSNELIAYGRLASSRRASRAAMASRKAMAASLSWSLACPRGMNPIQPTSPMTASS
ncbi:hypothetical protein SGRI78S_06663 [Streptomyces griseus subsp. griseus]